VTRPLAGVTVVVTRPRAQATRFAELMSEAGARPILLPALEIQPLALDARARDRLAPDAFDWTIYTSANAVECSLHQLPRPGRTRVAAIGRATARALGAHGIAVHAVPATTSDSEGLLALEPFVAPAGRRVLILKGEGGRTRLREALTARGATVVTGDVYRRRPATADGASLAALERACAGSRVVVAVTSVESLEALLAAVPDPVLPRLRDATLLLPGERVAAAARERAWRGELLVAPGAEDEVMAAALVAAQASGDPPRPAC